MTTGTTHKPLTPRLSIVIPARNEARNLEIILLELPPVHQVILVDGNSVDDTIATAKRVLPSIEVIKQTRKGKGNALACGFAAVTGDIVVMLDADGSANPDEIPAYVAALVAGADFAKGTRFALGGGSEDITHFRSLGNHGLNFITNVLLGTKYTDLCYGYNAFWSRVLPHLDLPDTVVPLRDDGRMHWGDGFEIETVINCRIATANLSIAEVPSLERLRIHGASNLNAIRDGFRVLRTIWTEYRRGKRISFVADVPVAAGVPVKGNLVAGISSASTPTYDIPWAFSDATVDKSA
ncbi:MAG: glycosyltransferase family 2 protein [Microbacteriaceae bacterium]|nr:glycosyltransferase family 2 protein [Microbacteriaceae bacterium]